MRRRLIASTVAIVLVVLGALAAPVGILVYRSGEQQIEVRLEQQLAQIVADYNLAAVAAGDAGVETDALLGLVETLGPRDGLAILRRGGEVFEFAPFSSDSTRSASRAAIDGALISVSTDTDPFDEDFRRHLNILLLLVLGALAAAAALAAVQGRQFGRPLERLARRAARLGNGDFSRQPYEPTAFREIDDIGVALDASADKVATMLAAERHFTADATHQLRTGITGVSMRLELLTMHPDPEVAAEATVALAQTEQLDRTIDELLAAARSRFEGERQPFDLSRLVSDHVDEWRIRYAAVQRDLQLVVDGDGGRSLVRGTQGLAGQVIGILLENSLRHGGGRTTVTVSATSMVVVDEGSGIADEAVATLFDGPVDPAARHGRGLSLARRLAQVDGASLDLIDARPASFRFRLVPVDS
ncbi:MAG: ATP-binding protein [Ilumatobacteraceae bacterium]